MELPDGQTGGSSGAWPTALGVQAVRCFVLWVNFVEANQSEHRSSVYSITPVVEVRRLQNGGSGARLRLPVAASPRAVARRKMCFLRHKCAPSTVISHTQSVLLSRWKTASSTCHERLLVTTKPLQSNSSVSIKASIEFLHQHVHLRPVPVAARGKLATSMAALTTRNRTIETTPDLFRYKEISPSVTSKVLCAEVNANVTLQTPYLGGCKLLVVEAVNTRARAFGAACLVCNLRKIQP